MLRPTRLALLAALAAAPAITGCSCGTAPLDFGDPGGGDAGSGGGGTAGQGGAGAQGGAAQGGAAQGGAGAQGGGSAECGDGVAASSEVCDGADLKGASCHDFGFSSPGGLTCTVSCLLDAGGCTPTCDGALAEPGEECDGADLGGHDCTDMGFASPAGAACAGCLLDYSMCTAECGNGVLEPGEECDGDDVGAATCADHGFVDPAGLACADACDAFDTSGCAPACNGVLEPGEDCDGADLGGHDCTDAGFTNPAGLSCTGCMLDTSGCAPTCGNGDIEPGEDCDDGNTANGDGCPSTCNIGGATCADAIPVTLGPGTQTFTGTTVGGGLASAACASAAPNRVYAVTVTEAGFLTAALSRPNTSYPSVLHARTTCADPASTILCADSKDPAGNQVLNGGEILSFPVAANQTVYLFVDGAAPTDVGTYALVLDLSAGTTCNDPVPLRIERGTPMTFLGTTAGKTASTGGTCGGGTVLLGASDVVYNVNFVNTNNLDVTAALSAAGTTYNSVLYARTSCDFGQINCDNASGNGGESLSFDPDGDSTIYIWVDGNNGAEGNYTLVLTPAAP